MAYDCCYLPLFYKSLPYIHGLVYFFELICGIFRFVIYFSPITSLDSSLFGKSQNYTSEYRIAFVLDWMSSIISIIMSFVVIVSVLIFFIKLIFHWTINRSKKPRSHTHVHRVNTFNRMQELCCNRAMRRCLLLQCNCPCYRPWSNTRFFVRFLFIFIELCLRIAALFLYIKTISNTNRAKDLMILTAVTLVFLVVILLLDFYHCCVSYDYIPYQDTTNCCYRTRKHRGYLPYIRIRKNKNEFCKKNPCLNRKLKHIAEYHSNNFQHLQVRWNEMTKKHKGLSSYIGFYQTSPELAMEIVQGRAWFDTMGQLGTGVYLRRSIDSTNTFGAYFVLEIDMRKVHVVDAKEIYGQSGKKQSEYSQWQRQHDTCYVIHSDSQNDEICIKNSRKQIRNWLVIIEEYFDKKIPEYQLDTEYDLTQCRCI